MIAERVVDRAVGLEADGHHMPLAVPEPFSRTGQRGGLVAGELILGAGVAFLLAGIATFLGPRARSAKRFWILSTAAAIWGIVLLPAVVYPPLPPGVISTLPVDDRQELYLATIAVGIGGFAAAAHISSTPRRFRVPLALSLALVPAGLAVAFFPESHADAGAIPSDLLTDFRIVGICSQLLFWAAMAIVGALLLRRPRLPGL